MERAKEEGSIKGIQVGSDGINISHLQFADDTILFCNNDLDEILSIKRILRGFQEMSGLKINMSKSMLCGVRIQDHTVEKLALIIGCKSGKLPMKYLGFPLGANPRRIQTWAPVIEKVEKALKVWRRNTMSTSGRLTLLISNMSSLPIYYMSLFKIPAAVANKIERLQRSFLWGESEERRKLHLIRWEKLSKNRKYGGLGIKRLLEHNVALLASWWWRFTKEKDALWVKVVLSKYRLDKNTWLPQLPSKGKSSIVWKDICSVGSLCADMGEYVVQGFVFKVNSGRSIKFWNDKWLGEESLKVVFPRLYKISTQQEAVIADMVDERNQDNWDFHFTRILRGWEKEQLLILVQLLSVVQLQDDQEDCIQWKWSRNLNFSVKSAYSEWEEQKFSEDKELFAVWKNICPPKVELFAWMAVQECVSSRSVLVRGGILNPELGYCPVCKTEEETPNHLLLLCNGATRVWNEMMAWWHIAWVCPPTLKTLFLFWDSFAFKSLEKSCWQATFYAVIWTIWLCRNDTVFNNKAWDVEDVVDLVKTRVGLWIKGKFNLHEYSVEDFKWNLDGIRKLKL